MVKLLNKILLILAFAGTACYATVFITFEEDLRATYDLEHSDIQGEINSLGISLRKIISDSRGDRLIFFILADTSNNLEHFNLHQSYAQLKGPMGKWVISIGRVPVPWGLLTEWSPERMPYNNPYPNAGINPADNGILVNGILGMFDYAAALTQGYGMGEIHTFPGPGVFTARGSITPDIAGDYTFGLSFTTGTSYISEHGHSGDRTKEKRTAVAVDAQMYIGRGTWRFEAGQRRVDDIDQRYLFSTVEYALLPRVDIIVAATAWTHGHEHEFGTIWMGASTPIRSLTLRGGYEYEKKLTSAHTFSLQLYRSFSTSF